MKRRHLGVLALGLGLAWVAGPNRADPGHGDIAQAPPAPPVRTEAPVPQAPVQILAREAVPLFEQLRQRAAERAVRPPKKRERSGETESGTRVLEVEAPAVVNDSGLFVFRDATDRSGPRPEARDLPKLTLEQRRAVVEAFRQSLRQRRGRER